MKKFTSEDLHSISNSSLLKGSKLLQLAPLLIKNLIQVERHLKQSNLQKNHKKQTILPAKHHDKILIVNCFHKDYHRCRRNQTLVSV